MALPHIDWSSAFSKALGVFLDWAIVAVIYYAAKYFTDFYCKQHDKPLSRFLKAYVYMWCLGGCLLISAVLAYGLGTHREGGDEYMDPGETVVDWVPSEKQQWNYGAKRFFVLFPASLVGAAVAIRKDGKLKPEERQKIKLQMETDRLKGNDDEGW